MWNIIVLSFYGMLLFPYNVMETRRLNCPPMCICDYDMGMNRANCSGQKIIDCHIEIPKYIEYLDLSYNDITTLDDTCFSNLKHLNVLSLDHNSINTIFLNAFSTLKKLTHLILSNNRLELFDRMIIEKNNKLTTFNLSANKFINLQDIPLLKSRSLQDLDLHSSQINHIHPTMFEGLTQLRSLDLSNNYLITLAIKPFARHTNILRQLNLDRNKWNCDKNMEETLKWLQQHRINVIINNCAIKTSTHHMFERMQMLPIDEDDNAINNSNNTISSNISTITSSSSLSTTELPQEDSKDINYHIVSTMNSIYNEWCPLTEKDKACDILESCLVKFTNQYNHHNKDNLNDNTINDCNKKCNNMYIKHKEEPLRIYKFAKNTIIFAFGMGCLLGGIICGSIIYCLTLMCDSYRSKKYYNREYRLHSNNNSLHSDVITVTVPNAATPNCRSTQNQSQSNQPPPPPAASQRHRRRRSSANTTVQSDTVTFFTSLFQRPARHRYYQTINQNATNLVRRLSQSRLFLNSNRAAARQMSSNNNNGQNNYNVNESTSPMQSPNSNTPPTPASPDPNAFGNPITSTPLLLNPRLSVGNVHTRPITHSDSARLIDNSLSDSLQFLTQSMPSLNVTSLEDGRRQTATNAFITTDDHIDMIIRSETPPPAYMDVVEK